ncbi:MAG: hypothetical protein RLZZ26_341 [Candidatus Parcubacteria bacterium]|jgi:hypothetical protein
MVLPWYVAVPFIIYASLSDNLIFAFAIVPVLAASVIITISSYTGVQEKMEALFYPQLAASLGWIYAQTGTVPSDGYLFSIGDNRSLTKVFSGQYAEKPFWIADYTYMTGEGKSREQIGCTVAQFTFAGTLPHIYCFPINNSVLYKNIGTFSIKGFTKLPLEGNFDTAFSVYVPEGQQADALQILEPDVMAKLMGSFGRYGFECVGSHLYLFTGGILQQNRASVLAFYDSTKRLYDLLSPELESFVRESTLA